VDTLQAQQNYNMVFYQLFITLLLFNCVKTFGNTEFCQKRAIKDCTTIKKLSEVFQALEGTTISKDQKFNKCTEFNTGKDDERGNLPKVCLSLRLQSAYNIFKFLCNNRP